MNSLRLRLCLLLSFVFWAAPALLAQVTRIADPVTIFADSTGTPISKYIYGQFIEHLGRCINDGIWAEMLEDRKFYYAVGSKESPWSVVGGSNAVQMTRENPFVGEQMPVVQPSVPGRRRGIVHRGLGLEKGKQYTGRLIVAGDADAGPVTVVLKWGKGPKDAEAVTIANITPEFTKIPLQFTSGGTTHEGTLEITSQGKGTLRIGTVSLMPANNIHGMRRDIMGLLKELNSPVYRWPGGNFVSGYNWKDGIGDPDKRPPRKNPAWRGIEPNDFGIHEYMEFCRELGADPYVTVNTGLGNVQSAVEELEYANGSATTTMGAWRARNGHAEPFGVHFWAIGNEMYGDWQLGHVSLDQYVQRHNRFVDAMRAVDSSIACVAVGAAGPWSEGMLKSCSDHMDLMSEHFYCGSRADLREHVAQIPAEVRRIADAHRRYRSELSSVLHKPVPVALDEWNYWYGPELYGEIGTRYFMKDGLGIAAGLHEYFRNSDIFFMANYAQTVNVIGAIKTTKTESSFETTGLVLKLYRNHFGTIPVKLAGSGPVDISAAWKADRKTMTVGIVNPTDSMFQIPVVFKGARLSGSGKCYVMMGNPMAYNEPGKNPQVEIVGKEVGGVDSMLVVPPVSVVLYEIGTSDMAGTGNPAMAPLRVTDVPRIEVVPRAKKGEPLGMKITSSTPDARIHYTLDGTLPTEDSPLYSRPVRVPSLSPTVRARAFAEGMIPSIMVERDILDENNGVNYRYFEGQWNALPDLDSIREVSRGTALRMDLSGGPFKGENYGIEYTAFLRIVKEGEYTFYTSSDDGSRLFVDGRKVVENDSTHGAQEKQGKIRLKPGMHPLRLLFFQGEGAASLEVGYQGPGIDKQVIPPQRLFKTKILN